MLYKISCKSFILILDFKWPTNTVTTEFFSSKGVVFNIWRLSTFTIFGINRENFNYEPKGNFEIRGDKIRHLKHDWSIITKPIVKNYFWKFCTQNMLLIILNTFSNMRKRGNRGKEYDPPPPYLFTTGELCSVYIVYTICICGHISSESG